MKALLLILLAASAFAQDDKALWDEYGLQETTQTAQATVYRFADSTGAYGAFQWQQAELGGGRVVQSDNYLLVFSAKPQPAEIDALVKTLPKRISAPQPNLADYLPKGKRVANSERYALGPLALRRFEPRIPESLAQFALGAEVQIAKFPAANGSFDVAVLSYPTPQIARHQLTAFEKTPGMVAKRAGPLVIAVIAPADAQAAAKLIEGIEYQANITLSERVPTARDNIGNLLYNIVLLAGIVMVVCLAIGIMFGILRGWLRWNKNEEAMIVLHLEDR